jgi:two-component system chemotaxis response regulator CheB
LFRSMNIRWVSIEDKNNHLQTQHGKDLSKSGLFSISPTGPPEGLAQHIRSIAQCNRRPSLPQLSSASAKVYRKLVLIGSSTGGVEALLQILSEFPQNCPPTAIVQHTGVGFTESLVSLLNRSCAAEVVMASDGMEIRTGVVCVASGRRGHLGLHPSAPFRCQIRDRLPVSGHLPSVDVLFESSLRMARNTVGVILTGMGKDGANGLLAMRKAGATTIAQDKASSVVYGMPRAAYEIGAVEHKLPLRQIASKILETASLPSTGTRSI